MTTFNVLSLGAGQQSTALYLKFARGEMSVKLDAAIFADTQEEPASVYRHLEWLKSLNGPPILTGTAGKLGNGDRMENLCYDLAARGRPRGGDLWHP